MVVVGGAGLVLRGEGAVGGAEALVLAEGWGMVGGAAAADVITTSVDQKQT